MNNTEIVQEAYRCFGKADIEGLLNLLTEDIEWTTPEIDVYELGGTRRGRDEVGRFFALLDETENITEFEPEEFIADGERVVVLGKSTATVRETGRSHSSEWVHIYSVSDGKISSFKEFFDTAAVKRAYQKAETA
jgi:uncharacterized protein